MTSTSPSVQPIVTSRPLSEAVPGACAAVSSWVSEIAPPAQLHTRRVGTTESLADIWGAFAMASKGGKKTRVSFGQRKNQPSVGKERIENACAAAALSTEGPAAT